MTKTARYETTFGFCDRFPLVNSRFIVDLYSQTILPTIAFDIFYDITDPE